jgi:hypothetical protein
VLYPFELGRRFWGRGGRFVIFTAGGGAQNSTQDGPGRFNWSQIRNSESFSLLQTKLYGPDKFDWGQIR